MGAPKFDFSQDIRQSRVAILLLIWKYYKVVFRQAIPILAAFAFTAKKTVFIIWGGIGLVTLLVFIMAILAYFRFYFRIENNELIIQKGVFKKSKLNIPFERIQTVNFEQNLLLQALNRYKVEVDTAGSAKKEFSFDALDTDVAKELRKRILDYKKDKISQEARTVEALAGEEISQEILPQDVEEKEELILALSPLDILKVGITENHIRAGLWLIAVGGYLFNTISEAGFDIEDQVDTKYFENLDPGVLLIVSVVPLVFLFLVLVSTVRTFLKHFNLKFIRIDNGFKIFSGLLNRKEFSAPDNKIQKFAWGDNPLRRIFGIFTIWLKQARSTDSDKNKSITIPVISKLSVQKCLRFLYGSELDKEDYKFAISQHFFWRHFLYFILIPALALFGLAFYLENYFLLTISALFLVYFSISTWVQYKKASYSFTDFYLKRKRGIYGNHFELIPWYKVQAVELKQSIYQRRKKIATVFFYTAAGALKLPYIDLGQAQKLRDYALYKAESSTKEWM